MTSDFVNRQDIETLKQLIQQLENDYDNYMIEDEDVDYEDLKKEIFNIQCEIKAIVECWAE